MIRIKNGSRAIYDLYSGIDLKNVFIFNLIQVKKLYFRIRINSLQRLYQQNITLSNLFENVQININTQQKYRFQQRAKFHQTNLNYQTNRQVENTNQQICSQNSQVSRKTKSHQRNQVKQSGKQHQGIKGFNQAYKSGNKALIKSEKVVSQKPTTQTTQFNQQLPIKQFPINHQRRTQVDNEQNASRSHHLPGIVFTPKIKKMNTQLLNSHFLSTHLPKTFYFYQTISLPLYSTLKINISLTSLIINWLETLRFIIILMENSIKFYKAKLHQYKLKFSDRKTSFSHSSPPALSKNLKCQYFKAKHKKSISEISASPQTKFNDHKVRLTVWNLLANQLSPKNKTFYQNSQTINHHSDAQPINNTSGNLTRILNKHKLLKEKYPWKLASKNINEITIGKIKPFINKQIKDSINSQKANQSNSKQMIFCPREKNQAKRHNKARSDLLTFKQLRRKTIQSQDNTKNKYQDSYIQYTLNIKETISKPYQNSVSLSLGKTWNRISHTDQVQAWTQRSLKDDINIINFNQPKTQKTKEKIKLSFTKRKFNKSYNI